MDLKQASKDIQLCLNDDYIVTIERSNRIPDYLNGSQVVGIKLQKDGYWITIDTGKNSIDLKLEHVLKDLYVMDLYNRPRRLFVIDKDDVICNLRGDGILNTTEEKLLGDFVEPGKVIQEFHNSRDTVIILDIAKNCLSEKPEEETSTFTVLKYLQ